MDVLGYFLAFTNLQAIGGRSPDLNDVSVKIADLGTLSNYLKNYPGFRIEDFEKDQINHVGDLGMYLSDNLRQFCLSGQGNPNDEGVVLIFTYNIPGDTSERGEKELNLADFSFLIRKEGKEGLSDDTVRPLLQNLHNQNSHPNRFLILKDRKQINKYIV